MPQNINLNTSPYFDDFDENRNYYRVLFKPGYSVQARELTTLQSILQNQIEKFGQHFFKDGALVSGDVGYDSEYYCVEVNSVHLGVPVVDYLQSLVGKTIKGQISNVVAKVENVISEDTSERNNNTLYIKYITSSQSDFITNKFVDGENLILQEILEYPLGTITPNNTFATTISSNSTSTGSAAKISNGIYFIRGFFLNVNEKTLILNQYNNSPSYRVGLLIKESFAVASNEFKDLLDNSQGFYNFASPGADRLLVETDLIKKPLDDFNDENFVELLRVENGVLESIVKDTEYNKILEEFARRTYDESGDYYITPFDVNIKESLNDYLGNNGIYDTSQTTRNGNVPSTNLACISISPGKAYVRGYEIEKISSTILDVDKARDTATSVNENNQFNFGTQIELNNVYGNINVGLSTASYVKLYDHRTDTVGVATGNQIGVAKLYDLSLKSAEYKDNSSVFDASLYDIQTYTTLTITTGFSTDYSSSTYIEGKSSGANGFLVSGITTSTTNFNLYQVSGKFLTNENLIVNGTETNRAIVSIKDYSINDVYQITSYETSPATFTADAVLSRKVDLANNQSAYTITAGSGSGISTIKTSNNNFYSTIKVGDVVSYTKPQDILPTYNVVTQVNSTLSEVGITSLTSVSNVNIGILPTSQIVVNDLRKITLDVKSNNPKLYSKLNNNFVSSLDLTNSNLILRKTINVSIGNSTEYDFSVFEGEVDSILVPFDEEAYTLVSSSGVIEPLSPQKIIPNYPSQGRITLRNVSSTGNHTLTISYQKINCKTRKKIYNRCSSITINKTNSKFNSVGTGLSFSSVYGCRIEDEIISLNVPEVNEVVGIFESSNDISPVLPSITVNIGQQINNLIKGEKIIGENSKAVATLVETDSLTKISFCYLNEKVFNVNEPIIFEESGLTATVVSYDVGDKNLLASYTLDNGSRESYLDFSRILRNTEVTPPKRQIKIIYNNYTINSEDNGTFVGVNSYDLDKYEIIPTINGTRCSDILDFRPRVTQYDTNSTISPFEFRSRIFSTTTSSSKDIVIKNSSAVLTYNYYLPRIDKLFLTKDGEFKLVKGISSITPKIPDNLDYSLEVATLYLPAYTFNVNDINISINTHKRYTMSDISTLDDRLRSVEEYTYLSLLETNTQNLSIIDPDTRLNRFKSGFFVDSFTTVDKGDVNNPIFRSSVDLKNRELHTPFSSSYLDLEIDESVNNNIRRTGSVVSLNYTDTVYISNKFTTTSENINPFNIKTWFGSLKLDPSTDTWVDTNTLATKDNLKWGNWNDWVTEVNTSNQNSRSRNIGIFASSLKPNTLLYGFYDDIDVSNYVVPKLIEIEMVSGTGSFTAGEDVEGASGNSNIIFRLAKQNHKYGPYNSPTETYTKSPYDLTSIVTSNYSITSTLLNVDIDSLNLKTNSNYYGNISVGMVLRGQTSGAVARVKNIRIISDDSGSFIGSFFISDPNLQTNPVFKSGVKTFTLTTNKKDLSPTDLNQSVAKVNFTSNGYIQNINKNSLNLNDLYFNSDTLNQNSYKKTFTSTNSKGKDPLAQTFEVVDEVGIFITKCDIYFRSKDTQNIPITLQIRTVQNGIPTQNVIPLSEVTLTPDKVNTSSNSSVQTTFTFNSPIFLEGGNEYSITLITTSNEYSVYTSQVGKTDISSSSYGIASPQPFVRSLFKSQNASTWGGNEYESLKFNLHRAKYTSTSGTINFYNPSSNNIYNTSQAVDLKTNSINTFSRSLILKLNADLSDSQVQLLNTGYGITQTSNTTFKAKSREVLGKISSNAQLSIVNPGLGFTSGIVTYTTVNVRSLSGLGTGAQITLGVGTGVAYYATITNGGTNYALGDLLTIDYSNTSNLGKDLILAVPNNPGILTERNSIYLDEVQGNPSVSSGDLIVNNTVFTGKYPSQTPVVVSDGLHIKINSKDHGLYSKNNKVTISGIDSDTPPTKITTSNLNSTDITVSVENATNFAYFEGKVVSLANPGYLIINNEIIRYTGINTTASPNTISISARGQNSTKATNHFINDLVFKYEFNGISLLEINKEHSLTDVDYTSNGTPYSIDLDSYYVKITNDTGRYFTTTKTGGAYNSFASSNRWNSPRASRNISYSILRPITNILSIGNTKITSKIRTYTSTSVNGTETSFLDKGYEDFSLSSDNIFNSIRAIFSKENETEYINGGKSLTLQFKLESFDDRLSPIIDLERVGIIAISNRINNPIQDYTNDSRVNKLFDDPNAAIYVSSRIDLNKPADSIKVIFDAYRHSSNNIHVAYRLFRNDTPDEYQIYELFPGYDGTFSGLSDVFVPASTGKNDYKTYEYTINTAPTTFTGLQIKIIRSGNDQANVPIIRDLRIIATS